MWHPDDAIELRDRGKDVIISGGENISSIEVEQAICAHPAVLEAAVVAIPHERWGERPKAFVTLRPGAQASEQELIAFCRERLAHFKCPDAIAFGPLPKTSTGKVQKFALREPEWAGHAADQLERRADQANQVVAYDCPHCDRASAAVRRRSGGRTRFAYQNDHVFVRRTLATSVVAGRLSHRTDNSSQPVAAGLTGMWERRHLRLVPPDPGPPASRRLFGDVLSRPGTVATSVAGRDDAGLASRRTAPAPEPLRQPAALGEVCALPPAARRERACHRSR